MAEKAHVFKEEGVEVKMTDPVSFVSRISVRGSTFYLLIPRKYAKKMELKAGDVVVAFLTKIKEVKLIPKKEVMENER